MFKKEYYCLVAGLPDLFFNENKLHSNGLKFRVEIKTQLTDSDYKLLEYLFLSFDNNNLLNLLFNRNYKFNCHGNYSKRVMGAEIQHPVAFPSYLAEFLIWQKEQESKAYNLEAEIKLNTLFYEYALHLKNKFLRNWFLFDLNLKNILIAINCNKFHYDLSKQLILPKSNSNVNCLFTNNKLKYELFEEELPFAEQIFRIAESDLNPQAKEKEIDKVRWDYLEEETFFHYFTIDKILSYTIKLLITERWFNLDAETGKSLLNKIIAELRTSYEFPVEFSK